MLGEGRFRICFAHDFIPRTGHSTWNVQGVHLIFAERLRPLTRACMGGWGKKAELTSSSVLGLSGSSSAKMGAGRTH